ncbi:MAG: tryptophan--tRNA ligase [Candidatus Saccharimonadales bacterium]
MYKAVILTGLRANNELHIGNYFGAMLPIIDLAKKHSDNYQINLFVPDLHSFTTPIDHNSLYQQSLNNLRIFAAAGLPLNKPNVYIYRQSYIPAHSELTWILDCFTGVGEMNRMTQFKDKQAKLDSLADSRVSMGLLNYPVLMAADILLYNASYVPVGDDQKQHLEFTRDIAARFNAKFGDIFVLPKSVEEQHQFFLREQGLRIRSLVDPTKKMSKSDDSDNAVIFLSDDPDKASQKVMSATTDSLGKINFDMAQQPGVSNLLQILALLNDEPLDKTLSKWQGKSSYGDLKSEVAQAVSEFLADFHSKIDSVSDVQITDKLHSCEDAMNKQANEVLLKVQRAVGLRS